MKVQIPAMRIEQNSTVLYQVRLDKTTRESLWKEGCLQVILYDPKKDEGTQRVLSPARISDLGRYIRHPDNFIPTTVLLNARVRGNDGATEEAQKLKFRPSEQGSCFGTLTIDTATTVLSITDGQGRIITLIQIQDALDSDFDLSCVVMMKDADEEEFQFYAINDLAIRVNKDIRFDSIARIGERYGRDRIETLPLKCQNLSERAAEARQILSILNNEDGGRFSGNPLYGKLILSNNPVGAKRDGLLKFFRLGEVFSRRIGGLIMNRNHIYPEYPDDLTRERTEKALLLCNFFKAIKLKFARAFQEDGHKEYMLFDSNALYVFEEILDGLMNIPNNRGRILSEREFLAYFHAADKLMQPVFWKRLSKEAADAFKGDHVRNYQGHHRLQELGQKIWTQAMRAQKQFPPVRRAAKRAPQAKPVGEDVSYA